METSGCWRRSDGGGDCRPAPATAMAGEAAGGHSVACGGDWSDFATYCRGGGEGVNGQQQRHLARLGHGAGRERGREERERVERAGRVLGFSFPKMIREGKGADTRRARGSSSLPWRGEVASSWRTEGHAAAASYARSDMAVHRIQIFNSTSNIPLRPILRASVTPKPRGVSKNSINKSCRSTYHLQLLLKLQSLIRPGLGDTRFQSGVHKN